MPTVGRGAGVAIEYEWVPDPLVFQNAIFSVQAGLRDRTWPLLAARQRTQDSIRLRFETQTDPSGDPWEPWADSYKPYAQAFPNVGILRQTQELYHTAAQPEAFVISNDALFYDSSFMPERGIWHQEGRSDRNTASGAPNPLPKRAFLGLSEVDQQFVFGAFAEWFDRVIDLYVTKTGRIGRRHIVRGGFPENVGQFSPKP